MNTVDVQRRVVGPRAFMTLVLGALAICPPPVPSEETVAAPTPNAPEIPPPEETPGGRAPRGGRRPTKPEAPTPKTAADHEAVARAEEKRRRKALRRICERSGA